MSNDPIIRLAALRSENTEDALEILFPDGLPVLDGCADIIGDAIAALREATEDAISCGRDEVRLDIHVAELLALELKRRKRRVGHPAMSADASLRREATLKFAEARFAAFREEGRGIEASRLKAAEEAAARAAKSGDYLAASTIGKLLKERAARRKVRKTQG